MNKLIEIYERAYYIWKGNLTVAFVPTFDLNFFKDIKKPNERNSHEHLSSKIGKKHVLSELFKYLQNVLLCAGAK